MADLKDFRGASEIDVQMAEMLSDKDVAREIEVKGILGSGQVAGMIREIVSVEQVIRGMVEGAAQVSERLGKGLSLL